MFVGLAILVGLDLRNLPDGWARGALFFALAGSMWGTYTVLLRHWRIPMFEGTLGVTAGAALLAVPMLWSVSAEVLRAASLGSVVFQGVMQGIVGGIISVVALIGAVRSLPVHIAGLLPVFTPVVALAIVALCFGKIPSFAETMSALIIAAGFMLSVRPVQPRAVSAALSGA